MVKFDTKKLQHARIVKGWNKRQLAQQIDVTPSVIGRVEAGTNTNVKTIKKIADALSIRMDDIVIPDERVSQRSPIGDGEAGPSGARLSLDRRVNERRS
jgi:ribosome-binding protein aMBF1 (putative translation factor)